MSIEVQEKVQDIEITHPEQRWERLILHRIREITRNSLDKSHPDIDEVTQDAFNFLNSVDFSSATTVLTGSSTKDFLADATPRGRDIDLSIYEEDQPPSVIQHLYVERYSRTTPILRDTVCKDQYSDIAEIIPITPGNHLVIVFVRHFNQHLPYKADLCIQSADKTDYESIKAKQILTIREISRTDFYENERNLHISMASVLSGLAITFSPENGRLTEARHATIIDGMSNFLDINEAFLTKCETPILIIALFSALTNPLDPAKIEPMRRVLHYITNEIRRRKDVINQLNPEYWNYRFAKYIKIAMTNQLEKGDTNLLVKLYLLDILDVLFPTVWLFADSSDRFVNFRQGDKPVSKKVLKANAFNWWINHYPKFKITSIGMIEPVLEAILNDWTLIQASQLSNVNFKEILAKKRHIRNHSDTCITADPRVKRCIDLLTQ